MLQETTYKRKDVGLLKKGFYYIRTARVVWDRVEIINRSSHFVCLLYLAVERYRVRRGRHVFWRTRRAMRTVKLPIKWIISARRYNG